MKYTKTLMLVLFLLFVATGCTNDPITNSDEVETGLTVYTSIYPIQYAVERIGGDAIKVETIYPPGVDAHSYEPTSKQIIQIAESDAFIYLGSGMETFAESAAKALQSQDVNLIELGENEELFHVEDEKNHEESHVHEHDDGHNHGDHDPHIWIDPIRMLAMSEMIKNELIKLDPSHANFFEKNFKDLQIDLLELDEDFRTALSTVTNKQILVSHAAYGYWEDRYGLEQIAILGLSSSSEPSQKQLTEIIEEVKGANIQYILYEQNTSSRISEVIQNEVGIDSLYLHNLSVLTDEDIHNGEDYLSLMKQNLTTIKNALSY